MVLPKSEICDLVLSRMGQNGSGIDVEEHSAHDEERSEAAITDPVRLSKKIVVENLIYVSAVATPSLVLLNFV